MTNQQGPAGPSGNPGRKRPGPTIDLKATEVASGPMSGEEAATGAEQRASAASESPESNPLADPPWRLIAAVVAAGAAVLLLLALIGRPYSGREGDAAVLETRLTQLEQQVRELADRSAPAAVDPKVIDALAARVGALEAALLTQRPGTSDPALVNRMATLEGELKTLDEKIGVVPRRIDEIGTIAREARQRVEGTAAAVNGLTEKVARLANEPIARNQVDALTERTASLERSTAAVAAELGKDFSGRAVDRAARLSAAATALNAAVERGESFAAELASLQALGADANALTALQPFTASGLPSPASLCRELLTLVPDLRKAAGTPSDDGSFLGRLTANAQKLVRVRPIGEVAGDDPAAILARVEERATQSDVDGARAELGKLPGDARSGAQSWIAKAQARTAAVTASRRLAAEALAALAKSPGAQ